MRFTLRNGLPTLGALVLVTATLYFGRPLLMPIALALLLSFVLSPLVLRIERIGIGRLASAIAVTLLIGSLLAALGWLVASQTAELASELPTYRTNLRGKIQALRGPLRSLDGAAASISDLQREIVPPGGEKPAAKVEVVEPPSVVGSVSGVLTSVMDPLAMVGVVAVLALFMLLEREELRDRLIWLTGGRDISLTTRALEDAERRVMRYLGTQSLLCAMHGVGVTAGLLWIGLPGAVVWGTLSAVLRFLPYFGPTIAAALPITLSIAAFPDWQSTAMTAGLFATMELISNNALEPWLYGTRTGLSPFGVIFSAFFWTWLWGIPGLILATPLTVCLVVAGRYVRSLEFVSVMLGDQPALAAEIRFYQRLLALDLDEAEDVLREAAEGVSLEEVSDRLVLPALRRLAEDEERELVSAERSADVRQRLGEVLEELLEKREGDFSNELSGVRALLVPAHSSADASAARWLALLLSRRGAATEVASEQALVSETVERVAADPPSLVCLSALTEVSLPHARLLRARLTALADHPEIAAGYWAAPPHELPDAPTGRARWITQATELSALANSVRARLPSTREEVQTSGAGGASLSWGMGGR
ncbi:MAG TPA: AI-2E family transporter [Myxococcota bacterium]|nr:AI-2E family transporter [Myxococcota bacterium]